MIKIQTLMIKREIEDAIFEGIYPTKIFTVGLLKVVFVIFEQKFPATLDGWLDFFDRALFIPGVQNSKSVLSCLPLPLFKYLIESYTKFFNIWVKSLTEHVPDIVKTNKSHTTWLVCTHVAIEKVIPVHGRLNMAQYFWVALCSASDKTAQDKLILDVFEMLKPWLDRELWHHLQEEDLGEGSERINRLDDEQVTVYENSLTQDIKNSEYDEISVG